MSGRLLAQGQLYTSYWPNIMEGPLFDVEVSFEMWSHNFVTTITTMWTKISSYFLMVHLLGLFIYIFNIIIYFYVSIACCNFVSLCFVLYVFYVSRHYVSIACSNFVSLCVAGVYCVLTRFNVFMFLDSIRSMCPFIQ